MILWLVFSLPGFFKEENGSFYVGVLLILTLLHKQGVADYLCSTSLKKRNSIALKIEQLKTNIGCLHGVLGIKTTL